MTIRVHSLSIAMFVAGLLALVAGAFAVGLASAGPADAAGVPYQIVSLTYLAPYQPGNQMGSCGRSSLPSGNNVVSKVGSFNGQDVLVCRATLRVVK